MECDRILPNLLLGSHPRDPDDIAQLRNAYGVSAVLCVQSDDDLQYWQLDWEQMVAWYQEHGIRIERLPIQDFCREDLARKLPACVDLLTRLLAEGHTVYVHCNVGMNRSPSIVIAYLWRQLGWQFEQAVDHVLSCRPCQPDLVAIRSA